MPPKDKAKKGAISGNYKGGKPLKEIMPAGSKAPREGVVSKLDGEPEIERKFDYEPLAPFPEWPGNEEARAYDFTTGCEKTEEGETVPFVDETEIFLPPSFKEFMRDKNNWLRPDQYLREVIAEQELTRLKAERKKQQRTRKNIRKQNMLNMGAEDMTKAEEELLAQKIDLKVDKAAIEVSPVIISHLERLETEAEIQNRKAEEEKKAEANKTAKKKAPAGKGKDAVADPSDEPQHLRIPIENSLDLGFSMPAYTKWVTSQFQLAKDRYIRDIDSNELIWQRIYPQENGMPVVSPSGKYWVKMRFMGKERLIEIDDRIPCDFRQMPIMPRTSNLMELWPQLLMKALLKVYSYKWYQSDAYFDQEIGDGSIIHSLTGLIPEHIPIKDFQNEAMPLFRNLLTDDSYFGHKAYLTAYCEESFRPKLPTQLERNKKAPAIHEEEKDDLLSEVSQATSQRMLGKLKNAASMAISVTTGKKLKINKNINASNIIPGFGYALMDIFENDFVDMDSIVKAKDLNTEEVKSPFKSPRKSMSPSKMLATANSSISKDEARRIRREERKQYLEEIERKEKEPPKQYSLLQLKTAVTRYPTINYVQPFTNEEIMVGKKCLLNHLRRTPEAEQARQAAIEISSAKKRRVTSKSRFTLNVKETNVTEKGEQEVANADAKQAADANGVPGDEANPDEAADKQEELKPRQRAMGGVWIETSDFPHAFQHVIVFHNMNRFENREIYEDAWLDGTQPFINNEKDVYLKLELDEEAFRKYKEDNNLDANLSLADIQRAQNQEENKDDQVNNLPGEVKRQLWGPDQVLLSYSPQPTKGSSQTMPRYFMNFKSVDFEAQVPEINQTFTRYHEGRMMLLCDQQSDLNTIWLKPNMMTPQGYTLWVGSSMRKISIVSQQDYLISQMNFVSKQYTCDFVPLQKGKNHVFGKWDFKVTNDDTKINLHISCPSDKYLQDYIRVKIIDKSKMQHQEATPQTLHSCNLDSLQLPATEEGYIFMIEGCMPYNTAEGQLQIDLNTNQENLEFQEIIGCEPVEYTDVYTPSKYGIIFKEKIFISPVDATITAVNCRLYRNGKDISELGEHRRYRVEILDNGKVIYSKSGCNQITFSHFMFRSNAGLVDGPAPDDEPDKEVKHNYVIQAVFELHLWPECKTVNEQTEALTWCIKMFNSETLALVKDTDKEDREKALKASWETNDPGRAERAARSRQRYLLTKKIAAGEELTEEEQEVMKEKRERVRKKDMEEVQNVKGGKGKAPAKADPKKGGKGAPVAEKTEEEEESKRRVLPEPVNHVNERIVSFLDHFKSKRLIQIECKEANTNGRKRTDEEKGQMRTENQAKREEERATHEQQMTHSSEMVQKRDSFRQAIFEQVNKGRSEYKEQLVERMEQRNAYREMIANRLEKQKALTELLAAEKIDIAALENAIQQAVENLVKEDVISRANKQLEWLKYCKEVEAQLQAAVQEKVKDNLLAVLEKIEKENILIEPKALNDAKNILNKLK